MAASAHLRRLREALRGPLTLGELSERLGEDGFGLLVLTLSMPFLQPLPMAGLSTVVGSYLLLLGAQHAAGRRAPWLPGWIARRALDQRRLDALLLFAERVFRGVETLARPRWTGLARRHRLTGAAVVALSLVLLLPIPIPFSNSTCALPLLLLAAGHLEEDGLLTAAGLGGVLVAYAYNAAAVSLGWSGLRALAG